MYISEKYMDVEMCEINNDSSFKHMCEDTAYKMMNWPINHLYLLTLIEVKKTHFFPPEVLCKRLILEKKDNNLSGEMWTVMKVG